MLKDKYNKASALWYAKEYLFGFQAYGKGHYEGGCSWFLRFFFLRINAEESSLERSLPGRSKKRNSPQALPWDLSKPNLPWSTLKINIFVKVFYSTAIDLFDACM